MKKLHLLFYYGFAKHLPKSTMPILGKIALRTRRFCCTKLFATCGTDLNVEQGAYFGNGKDMHIGNHVGLGKNFCTHNRILQIDDYLMMGEDVLFLGGGTSSHVPTFPWVHKGVKRKHPCILQAMCG